jgi:hypothetical protein
MCTNHLDMFPKLLDQSQFNRRARSLGWAVEQFRRYWIVHKGWHLHSQFLLEIKPVPTMEYKCSKKHSGFSRSADYERCVSSNLKYFGSKLVTVCTLQGLPIVYELVPVNTDERLAAETVIDYFSFYDFFADKGFLGWKWQTQILDPTNNLVWTPRRNNQRFQNTPGFDRWLNSVRERIEGVFHEVQNT